MTYTLIHLPTLRDTKAKAKAKALPVYEVVELEVITITIKE